MMAISNFADWFAPTATTANEAAPEPEATDQAPQDFAALLAASYTAPLAVAPPTVTSPDVQMTSSTGLTSDDSRTDFSLLAALKDDNRRMLVPLFMQSSAPPSLAPPVEISGARKEALPPLTSQLEDVTASAPQDERRPELSAITQDFPVSDFSEPATEIQAEVRRAIIASAQPVSATQAALPATFGEQLPIVTEVVKLAAAVVKTIVAEQEHHAESWVAMKDTPAPQLLPEPLSAPHHQIASQAQTPFIVEMVETTARASIASDAAEPLSPAFDNPPHVVANRAEVALPAPSLPLDLMGREDFTVEGVEAVTTAQTTPGSPSVNAPPPPVNVAQTTPSPFITQTIQPVLELAQAVHPNETRTLRFSLNPAELGRVEVEVTRDVNGRVSASLTVEQAATAQALTHGIGQLRESLERAGLVVEQLQVTTQLQSQTAQQFGQPAGQEAGQQHGSQPRGPNADSLPTDQMIADGTTPVSENKLLSLHA